MPAEYGRKSMEAQQFTEAPATVPAKQPVMTVADVAIDLGVSEASVLSWTRFKRLRSIGKIGNGYIYAAEDVALVKKLREENGTHGWTKLTPWWEEPEAVEEPETAAAGNLASRLIEKAKEKMAAEEYQSACELFALVVEGFDFSGT